MRLLIPLALLFGAGAATAQTAPPLLPRAQAEAIGAELSGSAALRTVRTLSQYHRMRGSEGFRAAAETIRDRLREAGLAEVEIISLPADGHIYYGTQRSRPGWNARFAELWEGRERIASWADQPISLAQDSASGRADADLVDIGAGTSESDYRGKDVRGRLVLTSSQPGMVQELAVGRFGAAGIVSWAQNQRTGWWGEDQSLIRWGHLDTFAAHPAFAFMVSPARAHGWQERLARGETVHLRAEVDAGQSPSAYLIPTAVIPGRDRSHEIVFSCHLDHPSPGANDNASGCAGELEIARSLARLIRSGALPQPERTLRFLWPCEVECTISLLNARPEFARRALATIHLDMIGGNTEITKSILRVYGSPPSLPSFVSDIGFAFGRYVNAEALAYADTGHADMPLLDPAGDRRALQAEIGGFNEGSDHQVWAEGSWRVPVIYLADWPDRYIHTQRDVPENLDPTKMRRAMFIAAASGWFLATASSPDSIRPFVYTEEARRGAEIEARVTRLEPQGFSTAESEILVNHDIREGVAFYRSLARFWPEVTARGPVPGEEWLRAQAPRGPVYRRIRFEGPMDGFGYSWFDDHLARAHLPRPRLLARQPDGEGTAFGYEALNLVDGRRSVGEIRDDLYATVGAVPVEEVAEYLDTLARLGVIEIVRH